MTHNTLYPAFVRIEYSSQFAPHTMTIPSVPVVLDVDAFNFDLPAPALDVDAEAAINDFVNVIKARFVTTTTFQNATLFTQASPTATPEPVAAYTLNIAGTSPIEADREYKATQETYTWRTTEYGIFKLVLLDIKAVSYERNPNASDASIVPIHNYVTDLETWIRGRDGGRPNQFLQRTVTHNEKLRRSYRMT